MQRDNLAPIVERESARVATHGSFRELVGERGWHRLPLPVRARFGRELARGETIAFVGAVAETRMTVSGWLWAQVARLVGAPLPLTRLSRTPAAVVVSQDTSADTQCWTRIYHEDGRLPQVIRSTKRFAGPTGLEECVNAGVGMALDVTVDVLHREERAGRFSFTLVVTHPWFGESIRQVAFFRDTQ